MTIQMYDQLGGDDRPILAFALFVGYIYGASLGAESLYASADTIDELKALPKLNDLHSGLEEYQIIDTKTFKITDAGNEDGPTIENGIEI